MDKVRVSRSARKHRIGVARIMAAMIDAGEPVLEEGGDALIFEGRDDRGVALFIVAVPDDRDGGGLTVIHCSPSEGGWRTGRKS